MPGFDFEKVLRRKIDRHQELVERKNRKVKVEENDALDVGKKLSVKAGDEITLTCGQSKIVMKKSGEITITGLKVKVEGKTKLEHKSDAQVNVKGLQTKVEGTALLDLKGSGIAQLKGSLTKIG